MAERVDAGDILQQAFVPVNDDETTLTLNAKCYDAAIGSFRKLVEDITNDRLSPKKQDPTGRSFFPLFKRPADGCVISWQQPAEQIDRFVRGLDFGRYPNPLGLPKIAVNGHLAIVRKVTVLADQSTAPAGTITYVGDDALHVATTSHDIALQHLTALDGAPLLAAAFIEQTGFHVGQILPALTDRASAQLTARYQETGRHELFWVKRLADLHLLELPLSINRSPAGTARAAEGLTARVSLPEELFKQSGTPRGEVIFAAFLAFLARISDRSQFDIGFRVPSAQRTWPSSQLYLLKRFHFPSALPTMPNLPIFVRPDRVGWLKLNAGLRTLQISHCGILNFPQPAIRGFLSNGRSSLKW